MTPNYWRTVSLMVLLFVFAIMSTGCAQQEDSGSTTELAADSESEEPKSELAYLMDQQLNIQSEVYWDNAGFIDSYGGTVDLTPTTDEGWQAILNASNEIDALSEELKKAEYSEERAGWIQMAEALKSATARARASVEARDGDELFQAGAQLYQVCVACHQTYWSNNRFTIE